MSDLSAYGSSIQGLKEQAQSCRVGRSPPPITPNTSHLSVTCTHAAFDCHVISQTNIRQCSHHYDYYTVIR